MNDNNNENKPKFQFHNRPQISSQKNLNTGKFIKKPIIRTQTFKNFKKGPELAVDNFFQTSLKTPQIRPNLSKLKNEADQIPRNQTPSNVNQINHFAVGKPLSQMTKTKNQTSSNFFSRNQQENGEYFRTHSQFEPKKISEQKSLENQDPFKDKVDDYAITASQKLNNKDQQKINNDKNILLRHNSASDSTAMTFEKSQNYTKKKLNEAKKKAQYYNNNVMRQHIFEQQDEDEEMNFLELCNVLKIN